MNVAKPCSALDREGLAQARRGVVGRGDVRHLARAHELVERGERLLERRRGVVAMGEVQIDALDPQAPERRLAAVDDLLRPSPGGTSSAPLPTFVATMRPSRRGPRASHSPMIVSDSPPRCPSIQDE